MKIQSVKLYSLSFTSDRRKFDVQGHIGSTYDNLWKKETHYTSQNVIDTVEVNNVKKVLVSTLSGLNPNGSQFFKSEQQAADEIRNLKGNDKVSLYPLLSCQPGISKNTDTVKKLIEQNQFYGLKFHPSMTEMPIKDNFEIYSNYLELADKKGLPCVFHSITDGKSDPSQIIKLAEKYPKLPVVLYHIDLMSTPEQMSKTIDEISNSVKNNKSNIFVDISWLTDFNGKGEQNKNILKQVLEKIGADRMLFGSDTPLGEMGDKEKYRKFTDFVENTVKDFYKNNPDKAEKVLNKIFYDNAEEIFIDKKWYVQAAKQAKKMSSKTIALIGAGVIIAAAIIGKVISNNKKNDLDNRPSKVGNVK